MELQREEQKRRIINSQNINMQNAQNKILRSLVPQQQVEKGIHLYSSKVLHPVSRMQITAEIYSKMIILGQEYIPFLFQIRFFVYENKVEFDCQENVVLLQLLDSDQTQWKEQLKNYLNQKGFHQQFKPIKKIGKGNFASVYLVEKIQDHGLYAVKAFSKQAAYSEENGKQCLIKEIQIMRQLNHKNTMKLYEVFESENSLYFVFQLIEGGSLYDKIKQKYKFKPQQIQHIVKGLLEGLNQMHSKKIMHRDLKPENILLRKKDTLDCVIADFGLAQFSDSEIYLFTRCGTPGFVAPEVINIKDMKAKYEPVCDIFSLGLIFYMLIFGKSLFKSKNYNDLVKQNRESKFNFQEKQFASLQNQTKDLLMKMLRVDPEERLNAQQSLNHPYFRLNFIKESDLEEETADKMDIETPTMSQVPKGFRMKKDSCIDFKVGKQCILTGHTGTVDNTASTKVSMCNSVVKSVCKMSKFSMRRKQNSEVSH